MARAPYYLNQLENRLTYLLLVLQTYTSRRTHASFIAGSTSVHWIPLAFCCIVHVMQDTHHPSVQPLRERGAQIIWRAYDIVAAGTDPAYVVRTTVPSSSELGRALAARTL